MSVRDIIMIVVTFAAMLAGAFLPQFADPLRPFPRLCLMVLLYLGFLSVGTEALYAEVRSIPARILEFTALRLLILPLFCFAVFQILMPDYALGAFLVGTASVGVMAPVFSNMVKADTSFVLVTCLSTSLLLPFSMPILLSVLDGTVRSLGICELSLPRDLSMTDMMLSLCVSILLPFFAAFITRKMPKVTLRILKKQYYLALVINSLSVLAVFSQYASVLHQEPGMVIDALVGSFLLAVLMILAGLAMPRSIPGKQRLAFMIGFGTMNNGMMLVISMQFFTVHEALLAAIYTIPFNLLLLVYRFLSVRWYGKEESSDRA